LNMVFSPNSLFLILLTLIFFLGVALTTSRAGIGLALVALAASVVLCGVGKWSDRRTLGVQMIFGVVFVGFLIAAYYSADQIAQRLVAADQLGLRPRLAQDGWDAAMRFFPFGAGMGTFENAFKIFETTTNIAPVIMNRAHNEYVEWIFEAGIFAAVALVLAVVWLIAMVRKLWIISALNISAGDILLMRIAGTFPFLIMLHSIVDYPMRTGAIAGLVAFCCALTIPPVGVDYRYRDDSAGQLNPGKPVEPA
jgi:O-antigen ligase